MPKFFIDPAEADESRILLQGDNAVHISKTLRMRPGEELTVCDGANTDYRCRILRVTPGEVETEVLSSSPCPGEPKLVLTLCVALPKSDKLELVVQKAVELGVSRILVFRSGYCVPDPDEKSFSKRLLRLERIAREAAGQSLRGRIPSVEGLCSFEEMLSRTAGCDMPLFFYEQGGTPLRTLLDSRPYGTAAAVIGPEGGFSPEEHHRAADAGFLTAHLGARILRCETAAITAAAAVMFHADEFA